MLTPEAVHRGLAKDVGVPAPPPLPEAAWINPPPDALENKRRLQ